ncbi:MAG: hypothetical protein IT381_26020 [Deltaproteobacteria bacterium]|nr:hypothetical protein [Deltaproteobacteria bacterium]
MSGRLGTSGEPPEFRPRLAVFGIDRIVDGSVLAELSPELVLRWTVALDRASMRQERFPPPTRLWLSEILRRLTSEPSSDDLRAKAAEVDAALRLSWLGQVDRVEEVDSPSADFRILDLNVEVYCPQQHRDERRVIQADLDQQIAGDDMPVKVAVAIGHPTTGSGRRLAKDGRIEREPTNLALTYPANKVIDRLLHTKRDAAQLREGEKNILWLDLKHGLGLHLIDVLPFRSEVAKGTCFTGAMGVWHAFYGCQGSLFLSERCALEWSGTGSTYAQQKNGWFRDEPKATAVLVAFADGIVLFENPWAKVPLNNEDRERLVQLSEFRPEASWFGDIDALRISVESMLAKIDWLARVACDRSQEKAAEIPQ